MGITQGFTLVKNFLLLTEPRQSFACGKFVCVGRNYVEHIEELGNTPDAKPLLFMKPASACARLDQPLKLPENQLCHHELELALLIGETIPVGSSPKLEQVAGIGLALDLTLRELQSELKKKGHPWEIAKAFDGSAPVSDFIPVSEFVNLNHIRFSLEKNHQLQQQGDTTKMIFPIQRLLNEISKHFTLDRGDVVLTGTPAGVSSLTSGDQLRITLEDKLLVATTVL